MAKVVVTLKVMPSSPDVDLASLRKRVDAEIKSYSGGESGRVNEEPVAFGDRKSVV